MKKMLWVLTSVLISVLVYGASTNDFFNVVGDKGTEDIACLGKPLPKDFRVGDEDVVGPNGDKLFCCQHFSIINPFFMSKLDVTEEDVTPYIDSGDVKVYYAESKTESITGSSGTYLRNYLAWTEGVYSFSLDPSQKRTMLVCSEKENIMQQKKWGIRLKVGSTIYDKDPIYNPGGTNAIHPNITRPPTFVAGNLSGIYFLDNNTLNASTQYFDYCLANQCVANNSLAAIYRLDNTLVGDPGQFAADGGNSFVKGVFGGTTGALRLQMFKANISINTTNQALNLSGKTEAGWGGWFNISHVNVATRLMLGAPIDALDGNISLGCANNVCSDVECYFVNSTGGTVFADKTGQGNIVGDGLWHFIYCQKNTTHLCAYVDNLAPTCTAHTAPIGNGIQTKWSINFGYTGTTTNASYDELQFRQTFLNGSNISDLYFDGLHQLRPNDFSTNNSICQWYITNNTGALSLAKTQTLGFNITTCIMNSSDSNLWLTGNNITINFTPVNNYESGVAAQSVLLFINTTPNIAPSIQLITIANNTRHPLPIDLNFSFIATDVENATLISRLIINNQINVTNTTTQNNTLTNFSIHFENASNYTWLINVSDGTNTNISETRIFEITGAPPQFLFKNNITNRTTYETTNQTYFINISYNTSAFNLTGNFIFGANQFTLTRESSTNDTGSNFFPEYNATLFRANIIPDLIITNNTNVTTSFNLTKRYGNGTNQTETHNDTQSILFTYIVSGILLNPEAVETSTQPIIANVSKQAEGLATNFSMKIEYNRTNNTAYQLTNSSTRDAWQLNTTSGLIDTQNVTFEIFAYFNITYNGVIANRTRPNTTQIVHQMILNNCTVGSPTITPTLNYSIRNETSNATVLAETEMSYTIYSRTPTLNRTYGFSFPNNTAPQICIYPRGGQLNISSGQVRYEATGYSTRYFFHNTTPISNLSQFFQLFLLSSTNSIPVSIQVIDQFSENIVGAIIKAYKYDIPGNFYTLVDSESTSINGIAIVDIEGNQTYKFEIYIDGEIKSIQTFVVTDDFYTIKIVTGSLVSIQAYQEMLSFTNTLTCNNHTANISLTWNDAQDITDQVCLNVYNASTGFTILNQSCTSNTTGTFIFGPYQNTSKYVGIATAVSTTDEEPYFVNACELDLRGGTSKKPFGDDGFLYAILIIGTMCTLGSIGYSKGAWDWYVPLFMLIFGLIIVNILGFLTISYTILVGIICIIAIIIFMASKR